MQAGNIWSKLANIPYKWIFVVLLIWQITMAVFPVASPFIVDPQTQAYWNFIQNLPAGSVYMWDQSATAMTDPLIKSTLLPLLVHLWRVPVKILMVSFFTDGPVNTQNTLRIFQETYPSIFSLKTYGTDYVALGYLPGYESAIAAFAANIRSVFPKDLYGADLDTLPMMKNVNTAKDMYAGRFAPATTEFANAYVRVLVQTYGMVFSYGSMATSSWSVYGPYFPKIMPYYFFQQFLNQYEIFNNVLGVNVQIFTATMMWTILIFAFVGIGNLGYWMSRRKASVGAK